MSATYAVNMLTTSDDIAVCEQCNGAFCDACDPSCHHASLCPTCGDKCEICHGEDR